MVYDKKPKTIRYIFIALSVVVMAAIFFFSSQDSEESSQTSGGITETVITVLNPGYKNLTDPEKQDYYSRVSECVRTAAHFSAFLALALFVTPAVTTYGIKKRTAALISAAVCFLYSVSDEIHQLYVPGRAFQLQDLAVDNAGVLFGVTIALTVIKVLRKKFLKVEIH